MYALRALAVAGCVSLAVAASSAHSSHQDDKRADATTLEDYDYVVVGSGPGGGPVSARLALNGYKVLLIDAGDDHGDAVNQTTPTLHLKASEYIPMKWDYYVNHYSDVERQEKDTKTVYTTPDGGEYVGLYPPTGSVYKGILYPRAGTLGGCSTHNALISIYPHESDWSNIAAITGDASWNPDLMRTYFERLEKCQYLEPNSVVGHGFTGWFGTSLTDLRLVVKDQKLTSLIVAAATALGNGLIGQVVSTVTEVAAILSLDINSGLPGRDNTTGLFQIPIATTPGGTLKSKRNGPRDFVMEVANAVNPDGSRMYHLDIRLNCLVTNIIFDTTGATPKATGVNFLDGQSLYRADSRASASSGGTPGSVSVTHEVIISAGVFNTPQLLKLSGIGASAELEKFGIPVVVDLPGVGTNMQDRYEVGVIAENPTPFVITKDCAWTGQPDDPCLIAYNTDLVGPNVYNTNGLAVSIVYKSKVASQDAGAASGDPDLLITGAPANFRGYFPGYSTYTTADALHWVWIILKAHSRNHAGTVNLRSADPQDVPQIDFNYFDTGTTSGGADQLDVEAIQEAIELSRKIYADMIPLDGAFTEVWPGTNISSTPQIQQWIKDEAWGHHASCTCPIGADDDPMAVLDSKFRVRGVQNLRVVDASAFPKIPGYYISVPIYIISEKAADVILDDARAQNGTVERTRRALQDYRQARRHVHSNNL